MERFRIVREGIKYRVQWYGECWWEEQTKWHFLYSSYMEGGNIAEFDSKEEALYAIQQEQKKLAVTKQGW